MPAFHTPIYRALRAATLALLLGGPAWAGVCTEDFEGAPDCGYRVTIVDDAGSALATAEADGRLEISGWVPAGSSPTVIVEPNVALRAGDSWAVEATVEMRHDLLPDLAARDSLQAWLSLGSPLDDDDDLRTKSGLLKGVFDVGGTLVDDGYFASSGYRMGGDEYSSVDPAVAGAGATTTFTLRVEYDAALAELTTLYRMDDGPFVVYPLLDGAGAPAPVLDPLADWMLAPDDGIEVTLLFAATRAAAFGDEPHTVSASFDLLEGDVSVDDLTVSGTLVPLPEPSAPLSLGAGLAGLLLLARSRRR